jgi:LPXTG-site transpeptidase (sortase) family protein
MTYDDVVDIGVFDGRIMSSSTTTAKAPPHTPAGNAPRHKGYKGPLVAGFLLLALGAVALGYGVFNLVVTNIIASREQAALGVRFAERQALAATGGLGDAFDPNAPLLSDDGEPSVADFEDSDDVPIIVGLEEAERASLYDHPDWKAENPPEKGEPVGRLVIPKIDLDWTIVEGVGAAELRKGPGHMPRTPVPGQYGNSVLSGHRTTYGAPFHNLDRLEPGDRFTVETLIGVHTYEVVSLRIVAPDHVWVIQHREGSWLTLTTCHPKYSSQQRLIVFAKLVDGPNYELITGHFGTDYEPPEPPEGTSPVPGVTTTTTTTTSTTTSTTTTTQPPTTTSSTTPTTTTTSTSTTTTTTSTSTTTTSTTTTTTTEATTTTTTEATTTTTAATLPDS